MAIETDGASLPRVLLQHCQRDEIDPSTYDLSAMEAACAPLHVRLRGSSTLADIALAAGPGSSVHPVHGMPRCAVVHGATSAVSQWSLFRSGGVYPMNAASAAAVHALHLSPGSHALELCCAPGGKLVAMADAMGMRGGLVGVDVNGDRLAVTSRLLRRHGVVVRGAAQPGWRARLLQGDATAVHVSPRGALDAVGFAEPDGIGLTRLPTHNSSAGGRKRARTPPPPAAAGGAMAYKVLLDSAVENRIKNKALHGPAAGAAGGATSEDVPNPPLFDAVLVDAECSHDGSLPHMLKLAKLGWVGLGDTTLREDRVAGLPTLQGGLLRQGWAHLRPGGRLVYSTCSLGQAQNEGVLRVFLEEHPDARTVPVDWEQGGHQADDGEGCVTAAGGGTIGPPHELAPLPGGIEHTLRFHPLHSGAGGLFIACLHKTGEGTGVPVAADE